MYYINIKTGEFIEFSVSQEYRSMNVPVSGCNFYSETKENIEKYVHPDDREFAHRLLSKEGMLKNLEGKKSFSYKYRLMVAGQPRHFQFTLMKAFDGKHFILSEKDIEEEITAENMRLENQKKHVTFSQIAETLAVNYDMIYYVDAEKSNYIGYECRNIYGKLEVSKSGEDFFADSINDILKIVHKNDRERVLAFVNKENICSILTTQKNCSIDYQVVAFKKTYYVRMIVHKTTSGSHFIIGIENIDEEVKREKQHLKALNSEKERARRDELTGLKNKTAYNELEKSVQTNMDNGMNYLPYALVVCDANNLKKINDTEGHVAGDEFIKKSAELLKATFTSSPTFRIGGDEFVVFLRGDDYSNRVKLMEILHEQVKKNLCSGSGPVLAAGMSEYNPDADNLMAEVFERADKEMYKNKSSLKKLEKSQKQTAKKSLSQRTSAQEM